MYVGDCTPEQSNNSVELGFLLLFAIVEMFVEDTDQKIREEKPNVKPPTSLRRGATTREEDAVWAYSIEIDSWKEQRNVHAMTEMAYFHLCLTFVLEIEEKGGTGAKRKLCAWS
jgi:hypothetical protein